LWHWSVVLRAIEIKGRQDVSAEAEAEKMKLALGTAFSAFVRNSTPNFPNGLIFERHEVPVAFFEDGDMTRITILLCFVECPCECRTTRRVHLGSPCRLRSSEGEATAKEGLEEVVRTLYLCSSVHRTTQSTSEQSCRVWSVETHAGTKLANVSCCRAKDAK
jgi:hypothetical protein